MKITIVTNNEKDPSGNYAKYIAHSLELGGTVINGFYDYTGFVSQTKPRIDSDIIIALGGDGTILHVAKTAALSGIPVLGVNIGRLGFLAGIEAGELGDIKRLVGGEYEIDSRMMIEARVLGDSDNQVYYALNDAVISKGSLSRIIDINVYCNDKPAGNYRADGVIISTPTGSTAYSLSAGGPIIDPVLDSIGITPICPHSLVSRTILFAPDSKIRVVSQPGSGRDCYLTIDGHNDVKLDKDRTVEIVRSSIKAQFVRLRDSSFYEVLFSKLFEKGI